MSDKQKNPAPNGQEKQTTRLDDESRVRVLSPTMLVLKRFVRNRLAITGLCVLVVMFVFSFLGGVFTPYTQSEVFRKYEAIPKDFASMIINQELRYTSPVGAKFTTGGRSQFISAMNSNRPAFTSDGIEYTWEKAGDDYYRIMMAEKLGNVLPLGKIFAYTPVAGKELSAEVRTAFEAAQVGGKTVFELDGATYQIAKTGKTFTINRVSIAAIASRDIFDAYAQQNAAFVLSFPFRFAYEEAFSKGEKSFTLDNMEYTLEIDEDNVFISRVENGTAAGYAIVSDVAISPAATDVFLTVPFKDAAIDALGDNLTKFTFAGADGTDVEYTIVRTGVAEVFSIRRDTVSQLIDMYAPPSAAHPLGTDGNGMDMLTRLMYGGRISLLVGFVVVIIELIIGVIIGGVAGYFGRWIDTLLMRFIDLFNCIPFWPVMIIIGAVMDEFDVDATLRIFLLMLILGVMGWTGIARVVRGQILSLREQDFMVAAEATGIRISRRIFKHLVPNVMPLLIVQATMSLGGIIITEATLSFLGLGLKYPMASWGTIINAATDSYVMTNFWFIWIPAGLLILLTVLGFNFVGDGLRDAFDPKMKR